MSMMRRTGVFLAALLITGMAAATDPGPARKLPAWEIEVTYHQPGRDSEDEVTARWRFEAQEEITRADGPWWRVSVRDADGMTPLEAGFLLDPRGGRIAEIEVREFYQGTWHQYPIRQSEPTSTYLQSFGALPLDYCRPQSFGADRIQHFRRTERQEAGRQITFRREYQIRMDPQVPPANPAGKTSGLPESQEPWTRLEIQDSFQPGSVRVMMWDGRLPWWREYRSPACTARLVKWEGGRNDAP
jgi:hypothetical protein